VLADIEQTVFEYIMRVSWQVVAILKVIKMSKYSVTQSFTLTWLKNDF